MYENYTIGLCLLDFVPVLAFLVGAYFLVRLALLTRGRSCSQIMTAGAVLVFMGGFLKATWKLLYTLGIADIQLFSEAQFVLLALGFLLMLVAVIMIARFTPSTQAGLPAMAVWKIPFLAVMTLSNLGVLGILTYISFKREARLAAWLFIINVLCVFGMAGMASGSEQTIANQWIEESINSLGQITFALGSYTLYKNYLD